MTVLSPVSTERTELLGPLRDDRVAVVRAEADHHGRASVSIYAAEGYKSGAQNCLIGAIETDRLQSIQSYRVLVSSAIRTPPCRAVVVGRHECETYRCRSRRGGFQTTRLA